MIAHFSWLFFLVLWAYTVICNCYYCHYSDIKRDCDPYHPSACWEASNPAICWQTDKHCVYRTHLSLFTVWMCVCVCAFSRHWEVSGALPRIHSTERARKEAGRRQKVFHSQMWTCCWYLLELLPSVCACVCSFRLLKKMLIEIHLQVKPRGVEMLYMCERLGVFFVFLTNTAASIHPHTLTHTQGQDNV